ncbi:hypothetical protein ACFO3J_21590 [Streptomyces polygonati]|uniref:DUF4435 domain-containing protein n=1 Tax=Streptomyces polygonati TaxID=1617087 RepID=A0ABV8HSU7_9ACTN
MWRGGSEDEMELRQPAELATLYELEPDIRDIIVEGYNDKSYVDWFLSHVDNHGLLIRTYPVGDRVYITDSDVSDAGYLTGARGRVIYLAQLLVDIAPDCHSALLIADADYASIGLDSSPRIPGLRYTDYASLESYALTEKVLEKMLRVVFSAPDSITGRDLIAEIRPGLEAMFLISVCLRETNVGVSVSAKAVDHVPLGVECPKDAVVEIFRTSLRENIRAHKPADLWNRFVELRKLILEDIRSFSRGHDIAVFIVKFLKRKCPRVFTKEDGRRRGLQDSSLLELALMSCLEYDEIRNEALFLHIEQWLDADVRSQSTG